MSASNKWTLRATALLTAVVIAVVTFVCSTDLIGTAGNIEGNGISYAHGITLDADGNMIFSYNGEVYKNEYERLLAEDGFIYGMDWNQFGGYNNGETVFAKNHITGSNSIFVSRHDYIERNLYNIRAFGYNAINVWITSNGEGFTYDSKTGLVTGLSDEFRANLKEFCEMCRRKNLDFVPTLLVHGMAGQYNKNNWEGLSPSEQYFKYFRYYYDDDAREAYLKNGIEPICEILSDYQDVVAMVNLTVENGTAYTNDIDLGIINGTYYGFDWEDFASLQNALHDASKKYMPDVPTCVEDVGYDWNTVKYNDLKVDIIGYNEYGGNGSINHPHEDRFSTRPIYVGEYNMSGSEAYQVTKDEEYWLPRRLGQLETMVKSGLVGAFFFNWMREEGMGHCFFDRNIPGGSSGDTYEAVRICGVPYAYMIEDFKNEHRGTTGKMFTPVLLWNNDSPTSYWIGGKDVKYFILERSTDGGEWQVIADKIDPLENTLNNSIVTYTDENREEGKIYRYRVTAVAEDGKKAVSKIGNENSVFVPDESFVDSNGNYAGGFEQGGLTGVKGQWPSDGWFVNASWGTLGEFLNDPEVARTGNYCLHIDRENGIGTTGDYGAKWTYNLTLKPNTAYEFSGWYKSGRGSVPLSIQNSSDGTIGWLNFGADASEWTEFKYTINVPADGKIALRFYTTTDATGRMYLDDLSLKEMR